MLASRIRSLPSLADPWLLGGAVAGSIGLTLQITHPLQGRPTAPSLVNWLLTLALVFGLVRFLARGRRDERWLALSALLGILLFLGFCEPWTVTSSGEFVAEVAGFFSTTHFGVPFIALAGTWLNLGLGLLCGRAVLVLLQTQGPWQRASAWLVGLMVGAFGAHGVIGYASGNSSLLLP